MQIQLGDAEQNQVDMSRRDFPKAQIPCVNVSMRPRECNAAGSPSGNARLHSGAAVPAVASGVSSAKTNPAQTPAPLLPYGSQEALK